MDILDEFAEMDIMELTHILLHDPCIDRRTLAAHALSMFGASKMHSAIVAEVYYMLVEQSVQYCTQ